MDLKEIISDAWKYTVSDWTKVLLLGLTLFLLDFSNEGANYGLKGQIFGTIFFISGSILTVVESGYLFRIIEETIKGSKNPPNFNKFKELLIHGVKDLVMGFFYAAFPIIIILSGLIVAFDNSDLGFWLIILGLISTFIFSFLWMGAVLNMAHNHGSLRAAFQFKIIFRKIRLIGFKRLSLIYIGIFAGLGIITITLKDELSSNIPIFGMLIFQLIIAPILLIFSFRTLGLIDKPS
ncbi:MAG: DUF4013 domain-containing protein [Methanobacteriaceae archaeon]|nr:DUF4013 domain-containing protein [Methanobacteriaceae archaeon]